MGGCVNALPSSNTYQPSAIPFRQVAVDLLAIATETLGGRGGRAGVSRAIAIPALGSPANHRLRCLNHG